MKTWLLFGCALAVGCTTKANGKYCATTCADPSMICDTVAHACVPSTADLGMADLSVDDLGAGADLTPVDLENVDLTPPPACVSSATCPSPFPVCNTTAGTCRECNSAADDAVCVAHSAATAHCKLAGTNAGLCVACNVSADCAAATPVCNPDGTCRQCTAHMDCDTGICDFSGTATNGQCVPATNIVYVNYVNDTGQSTCTDGNGSGKDGSQAHPYCQITTALTLIGISSRAYVHVAGSATIYDGFEITGTSGTLTFVGPGKAAMPQATVQSPNAGVSSILIDPAGAASVVLDGFTVIANGNGRAVDCNGAGANPDLLVINSSITNAQKSAVFADKCNFTIRESYLSNSGFGVSLGTSSSYSIQNCFVFGNQTGVSFPAGLISGSFNFNTVAYNTMTTGIDCGGGASAVQLNDSIVIANKSVSGTQFTNGTHCTLFNVATGADAITSSGKITSPNPVLVSSTDLHLDVTPGANLTANTGCCIDKISGPSPTPSPLPTVDIDNNSRPKGAGWDIGAHEAK